MYKIIEIKSISTNIQERYTIKLQLNDTDMLDFKNIITKLNKELLEKHPKTKAIWMYIGKDDLDTKQCNWMYFTEWLHDSVKNNYLDFNEEEIINNIKVKKNSIYDNIRESIIENIDETNSVVNEYKRVYSELKTILNEVKSKFDSFLNEQMTKDEYMEKVKELKTKAQGIFISFSNLDFPTVENMDIQKNYSNMVTDVTNLIEIFADEDLNIKYINYSYDNMKKDLIKEEQKTV